MLLSANQSVVTQYLVSVSLGFTVLSHLHSLSRLGAEGWNGARKNDILFTLGFCSLSYSWVDTGRVGDSTWEIRRWAKPSKPFVTPSKLQP